MIISLCPATAFSVDPPKTAIALRAGDNTKYYDGTPLKSAGYKLVNGSLKDGDKIRYVMTSGSQTDVGSSDNIITAVCIVNSEGRIVTDEDYEITKLPGTLTVYRTPVKLTVKDEVKVYNGTPLTGNNFILSSTVPGFKSGSLTVTADCIGTITDAGTVANTIDSSTVVIKNSEGRDVTSYFTVTTADGKLKVLPVDIEIKAKDASKDYDGSPLTLNDYEITNGAFVGDQGFESVTVTGSQTIVGTSDNVIESYVLKAGTNPDNYNITKAKGTLSVNLPGLINVTVTADDASRDYNGQELTKKTFTHSDTLKPGDVIGIDESGFTSSITNAGSTANVIDPAAVHVYHNEGGIVTDVTSYYNIICADGLLTVNKKNVTITADSDDKPYDGEALTDSGYTLSPVDAFPEGEGVIVTVTGSQLHVGTADNIVTYELKDGTDADNYNIVTVKGTLEVTNPSNALTIDVSEIDTVYDGQNHAGEYTYTGTLMAGDVLNVVLNGSRTDAGLTYVYIDSYNITHADGEDVTANYSVDATSVGYVQIAPIEIGISTPDYTREYNGEALVPVPDDYTVTGECIEGESFTVTLGGSQTIIGFTNITCTLDWGDTNPANYHVTYDLGMLTVTQKAFVITADSASRTYDGTPLTKGTATWTDIPENYTVIYTVEGSQTNAGTSLNTVTSFAIYDADNNPVTGNYACTAVPGTLTVEKKAVTVKADSDTFVYDGTSHTVNTWSVISGGFIDGETVNINMTAASKLTTVGNAANIIDAAGISVVKADSSNSTDNYIITCENGSIEVTALAVTVIADDASRPFDGLPLTKDSAHTDAATPLAAGDNLPAVVAMTAESTITSIGKTDNIIDTGLFAITNADGDDVTFCYDITFVNGILEVTRVDVTITAKSLSKPYDGTALTAGGYDSCTGVPAGYTVLVTMDPVSSITKAGTQRNKIDSVRIMNGDTDVTSNYRVVTVDGTLTVTRRKIMLVANDNTWEYDATAHTEDGYSLRVSGEYLDLVPTETISQPVMTNLSTITHVGTVANEIMSGSVTIRNAYDQVVTGSYDITYVAGLLEVTPKAVTVVVTDASAVYDGLVFTSNAVTMTGAVDGHYIDNVVMTNDSKQTDVGSHTNDVLSYVIRDAEGNILPAADYTATITPGTLTVTGRHVVINVINVEKEYDGNPLVSNYAIIENGVDGHWVDAVMTAESTITNRAATPVANVIDTYVLRDAYNNDVTANYIVDEVNPGTLTVYKRLLNIAPADLTVMYDGTVHGGDGVHVFEDTPLVGVHHVMSGFTADSYATDAGRQTLTFNYVMIFNGIEDVSYNYDIHLYTGTLIINPRDVTITADSKLDFIYDDTEHRLESGTASLLDIASGLITGHTFTLETESGITDVGTTDNIIKEGSVVIYDGVTDVTANYNIYLRSGKLGVLKRDIVFDITDETLVYNGTAQSSTGYTLTDPAMLVSGHTINAVCGNTITNVGSITKDMSFTIMKGETDVTDNYNVIINTSGMLDITPVIITVTADSDSKTYDSTPLTNVNGASVTSGALAAGDELYDVVCAGTITDYSIVPAVNTITSLKIRNAEGVDTTANYTLTFADGTLTIVKRDVVLTAQDKSWTYDSMSHTWSYADADNLVDGQRVEVTMNSGSNIAKVADSPVANIIATYVFYDALNNDVSANYNVTSCVDGELTITKRAVTITMDDLINPYDGLAHSNTGAYIDGAVTGHSVMLVSYSTITDVGEVPNVLNVEDTVIIDEFGNDVKQNYEIIPVDGTLTITPRTIYIRANDFTMVYAGLGYVRTDAQTYTIDAATLVEGLVAGQTADVTMAPLSYAAEYIGNVQPNTFDEIKIFNGTADVTSNYDIMTFDGDATINQLPITIKADGATSGYDGLEHRVNTYLVTAGVLAAGDRIDSVVMTEDSVAKYVTVENKIDTVSIKAADDTDVTAWYGVTKVNDNITIVPLDITITANDKAIPYSGAPLTCGDYTLDATTPLVDGDYIDTVTMTAESTITGEGFKANVIDTVVIRNAEGVDITSSYNINKVDGILAVGHNYGPWICADADRHSSYCPGCGNTVYENHQFSDDPESPDYCTCPVCNYSRLVISADILNLNSEAMKNGAVKIAVRLDHVTDVAALKFNVNYDNSVMKLVKVEKGDEAFDNGSYIVPDDLSLFNSNGQFIYYSDFFTTPIAESGILVYLTFIVDEGAAAADYTFDIDVTAKGGVYDDALTYIEAVKKDATVTVLDVLGGDIDNDGEITLNDIVKINEKIKIGEYVAIADIDSDGDVDEDDLNLMRIYLMING